MVEPAYFGRLPLDDLNRLTFNFPSKDLLADSRFSDYVKICIPLYKSFLKEEYAGVKKILQDNSNRQLLRFSITHNRDTAPHVAVTFRSFRLVVCLMEKMADDDLILQNVEGHTALSLAVSSGDLKMARFLDEKCPPLLTIGGQHNMKPLHLAAMYGRRGMANFLYGLHGWMNEEMRLLFLKCLHSGLFDIARRMLTETNGSCLEVGQEGEHMNGVLLILALKPYAFENVPRNIIWRLIMSYPIWIIIQGIFEVRPPEKSDATLLFREIWRILLEVSRSDILRLVRCPRLAKTGSRWIYPRRILGETQHDIFSGAVRRFS